MKNQSTLKITSSGIKNSHYHTTLSRNRRIIVIGIILVIVFGISYGAYNWRINRSTTQIDFTKLPAPSINKTTKNSNPKIVSALIELTKAKNYQEYAKTHGLQVKDNKVQVYIVSDNDRYTLPVKYGEVTGKFQSQNVYQAWIVINLLEELTNDPHVLMIRIPDYGEPV